MTLGGEQGMQAHSSPGVLPLPKMDRFLIRAQQLRRNGKKDKGKERAVDPSSVERSKLRKYEQGRRMTKATTAARKAEEALVKPENEETSTKAEKLVWEAKCLWPSVQLEPETAKCFSHIAPESDFDTFAIGPRTMRAWLKELDLLSIYCIVEDREKVYGGNFTCIFCIATFKRKGDLYKHIRDIHEIPLPPFKRGRKKLSPEEKQENV
ncbi:hypothetical protein BJV82DRAFT_674958 [Fennellomyces sp. T-0311]|nr:hypothetical protein BJV82DRAFT_674958 [Fennellomyces sp. T-0311]